MTTYTRAPRKVLLITFGLGGHSMDFDCTGKQESRAHLSGYDRPDGFNPAKETDDLEGATVIDKIPALESDYTLAITLPMCDVRLAPGTVSQFTDGPALLSMMPGLGGSFRTLAQLAQSAKFGGLDEVSIDIYAELWRSKGARIGTVRNNTIEWEAKLN